MSKSAKTSDQTGTSQHAAAYGSAARKTVQTGGPGSALHESPRMTAQRQRATNAFGGVAQRAEEEEPLQGKFDTAQRVEEEELLQGKFATAQRVEDEEPLQGKFDTAQRVEEEEPLQAKNGTGMPDQLKAGIESMSGMNLSDVKVHHNSNEAAQLQAHAYAQGSDIHVAPGQEKHLPHEAWHVVQQRQGRVKPTMQLQGVAVNDDAGLEKEADVMGAKALQRATDPAPSPRPGVVNGQRPPVTQRRLVAHARKDDEGTTVASLGDVGFLAEYSRLLAADTSVLVDGEVAGDAGLTKTLKKAKVDGGKLSGDFVESLMGSGSWLPSGEAFQQSLVKYVQSEEPSLPGLGELEGEENETAEQYMRGYDFGTDYASHVRQWIIDTAGLADTTTVDAVNGRASKVPLDWKSDLAYLVYEQTKSTYYGDNLKAAYVAPFKAMIGDTNTGAIAGFNFVRKFGSEATDNLGAEFTVAGPQPMVDKYNGKAVLHTHYGAEGEPPNYGHTKPYEQRFAPGFGYTIVSNAAINGVDDSQSNYDDL